MSVNQPLDSPVAALAHEIVGIIKRLRKGKGGSRANDRLEQAMMRLARKPCTNLAEVGAKLDVLERYADLRLDDPPDGPLKQALRSVADFFRVSPTALLSALMPQLGLLLVAREFFLDVGLLPTLLEFL